MSTPPTVIHVGNVGGPPGPTGPPSTVPGPAGPEGPAGPVGPTGAAGEKWFSSASSPGAGLGVLGDWHLHTTTGDVSEKTTGSAWTLRGNIKGPTGATGPAGPTGADSTVPGPQGPQGIEGPVGPVETTQTINAIATATYTIVGNDAGRLKRLTFAGPITVTLPSGGPLTGQRCDFVCIGGVATFVLGGGATWDVTPTPSAVARSVGSFVSAIKTGTTTWALTGDLA